MNRLRSIATLLLFALASEAQAAKYGYCYVDFGAGSDATRYVSGVMPVVSQAEAQNLVQGGAFREGFLDHVRSRYESGAGAVSCETWETQNDARRAAFDSAISGDTMRVRTDWLGGKASTLSGQKIQAPMNDRAVSAQKPTSLKAPPPDAREDGRVRKAKVADEGATRRAADEAEFQAKEKAYWEGVAAHEAALEQYEKAVADTNARNAASAAKAKIQLDEYARKQAAYEADVARNAQEQAEYEAKLANPQ